MRDCVIISRGFRGGLETWGIYDLSYRPVLASTYSNCNILYAYAKKLVCSTADPIQKVSIGLFSQKAIRHSHPGVSAAKRFYAQFSSARMH